MNNRERRGSVKRIISVGIASVLTALFGPVGATLVDSIWRLYHDRYRLSCFSSGPTHIRTILTPGSMTRVLLAGERNTRIR